jgi:hypothetical protein
MNDPVNILFWSKYDEDIDKTHLDWVNREINISPFHILTLQSHLKYKHNVLLYSYQKFKKNSIPKGIKVVDANKVFPSKVAFKSLMSGHSIAHISDAVRLKVASEKFGIVIDMDAVIIRELPKEDGWFASMPAKRTGGVAPKWGKAHPPLTVNNNSWNGQALGAFPIKVNKNISKHIASLAHKIMHTLMKPPSKNSKAWNYVIWTIKKIMPIDKNLKVYKPIHFCPLPAWLGKNKCYSLEDPTRLNGKTEIFGHLLPSIDEIFNNSYIIQHFFESAFNKSQGVNKDFWLELPDNCLLAKECEHILGKHWRIVLSEAV